MSEEGDDDDVTIPEPEPEPESCIPKEPTFHGRLRLNDFMFNGTNHSASPQVTRRSARMQQSLTTTSLTSGSNTTMAPITRSKDTSLTSKRTAQKRKALSRAPRSDSPSSSTRATTTSTAPKEEEEEKEEEAGFPSPRKKQQQQQKKKKRTASTYAPPSTYAHLPPLIDVIAPNLLILFIGLNPGVQTARTGHAYAHPSNLFWKLLYSSGITPVPCKAEEDRTLPARFGLGNTNIVARPSRNGAELSKAEMDAGVAVLEAKCRRWRPEVVCVVGKGIWESVFRVWKGRNLAKGEFAYGWQDERMGAVPPARDSAGARVGATVKEEIDEAIGVDVGGDGENGCEGVDDGPWEGSRIFVATSTSGLAASLRPEEKERIWKILGDWCVQRREERAPNQVKMEA
ncbi:DNA glycosylase [Astrocystis sublimbata]|nr:DNA glycosylase [Astrocystis sublimbata]